jgi:hypothetical protein
MSAHRQAKRRDARWAAAVLGFALALPAFAAGADGVGSTPPGAVSGEPAPTVRKAELALGMVTLDKQRRAVSFPVVVNQREGVVEYAVVTAKGKTHESVFRTEAEPRHIHLAMLLLGAHAANTNVLPAEPAAPLPGERILAAVLWTGADGETRRPLEEFIVTTNHFQPLPAGPWVYNGSHIVEGTFVAQSEGAIISLHTDPNALINNPRPGRENDDLHYVNAKALPPDSLPLRIRLQILGADARPASPGGQAGPTTVRSNRPSTLP